MKNFYKITKGQLIWLWIFGGIGWIVALSQVDYNDSSLFFVVLIPAAIIFYTIGWVTRRKDNSLVPEFAHINKKVALKKVFKILIIIIVLGGLSIFAITKSVQMNEKKNAKEDYLGTFNRYEKNLENAKSCVEEKNAPLIEQYTKNCKERYNKTYESYKDCKRDMYWQSHNQCLNWPGSNYEAIDCSEATILEKANSTSKPFCYSEINREYLSIISYEENVAMEFLDSLAKSKSTITLSEIQVLYDSFPQEAFNEKTRERLNKYIENKGYTIEK